MKGEAVVFPPEPDCPESMNPELFYRLTLAAELLSWLFALRPVATAAEERARAAVRQQIFKGAREAIRDLGPITGAAQDAVFARWSQKINEPAK